MYVENRNDTRAALGDYLDSFKDQAHVFISTDKVEIEEEAKRINAYTAL